MLFGFLRDELAFIAFLHFVSGPVHFTVASARLLKGWYCMIEYILVSVLSLQQSSACEVLFATYVPEVR